MGWQRALYTYALRRAVIRIAVLFFLLCFVLFCSVLFCSVLFVCLFVCLFVFKDALKASDAMISKEPKNPLGYRRKGSVLRAMGDFKEACKVFKKARYGVG